MRFVIITLTILFAAAGFAQPGNMVRNPYFKGSKPSKPGQIAKAYGWNSPGDDKADLFSDRAKGDYGSDNIYGRQLSDESDNYGGIVSWSYKDSKPVTYLQTELEVPLEEGRIYCLTFHLTLGDLAKYASNNIGMHISNQSLTQKQILSGGTQPVVLHSRNIIYEEMDVWEPVCKAYTAKGGEKFLTIGNFDPEKTETKKVKRPKGFSIPQKNISYYFICDVRVQPMDSIEECLCEKLPAGVQKMEIVYDKEHSTEHSMKTKQQIEIKKIHFEYKKNVISASSMNDINEVADLLTKNPELRIEITGNTDSQEQLKVTTDVSAERAKAVADYLESKGIAADRMTHKGIQDASPVVDDQSAEARAQNRRVDFKVL